MAQDSLLQLAQQGIDILVPRQPNHDVKFLNLDIRWVVVFAEEHPHLVLENLGSFLEQEVDVTQGDPLNFRFSGDESD